MADIKDLADGRSALLWFDPRRLRIKDGLNARDLETPEARAHISFLKQSIKANGFLLSKAIEVYRSPDDEIFVTDGHCRLTACMEAIDEGLALERIPCIAERKGTSELDRIFGQNLSNEGLHLTALEQGFNIKRAMALGATLSEVAKRLGKSETHVGHLLDLQAAPVEVHDMIRSGKVSATLASQTVRRQGGERGVQSLQAGVATAAAKGKKKATAKDIPVPAPAQTALDARFEVKDVNDCQTLIRVGTNTIILTPDGAQRLANLILDHFAAKEGYTPVDVEDELEAAE
jgi:ParB-like chromosome segregation protein Spo0J